uniref:Protein kinase domain-containing protein n=1 Tax=Quercus lobata TaxID=97700 RepID=A0A7N2L6E0_QUELO
MHIEFEKGIGPKSFTYREIIHATNNFAEGGKPREGGFGGVYEGLLSESNAEVAVKRVSKGSKQGKKEYISEVTIISHLRHKNLVQLIGWCHEQGELLLVYEYMPNGSLDTHLFGVEIMLIWPMRYKIALGLASASLYLHEEWEQYQESGSQTTVLAGTMGYLAPECVIIGKVFKESDVYSFGVVSLEIACGRKPVQPQAEPNKVSHVEWVWDLYGKDQLIEVVGRRLNMEYDEEKMKRLMVVGLWCYHPDPTIRPSIRLVINVLSFETPLPTLPSKLLVSIYVEPPIDICRLSYTSTSITGSMKGQTLCSCSSCSTNSTTLVRQFKQRQCGVYFRVRKIIVSHSPV